MSSKELTSFCFVDGHWQSDWPAADRGLQYGDGLFETMRMKPGMDIPLWPFHLQRLQQGLSQLDFPAHASSLLESAFAAWLKTQADHHAGPSNEHLLIKLIVTRGENHKAMPAVKGYDYNHSLPVNLQIQLSVCPSWPCFEKGIKVGVNPVRLSSQPLLAGIKHLNRLEQVLARGQFQPDWQESIMMDQTESVIEGCMSNLYLVEGSRLVTPRLDNCGVNGTVRRWLFSLQALDIEEDTFDMERLYAADGLLMSNSVMGIQRVSQVDDFYYSESNLAIDLQKDLQNSLISMFNQTSVRSNARENNDG